MNTNNNHVPEITEDDWTNQDHVAGAVWAQLEDLSLAGKISVIGDIYHELTAPHERVRRGATVIAHYRTHFEDHSEDDGTILSDLLADLIHWSAATDDVDFDSRLDLARYHFDEESEEDEERPRAWGQPPGGRLGETPYLSETERR